MATSGSTSVAVTSYDTLTFKWTLSSQSTENNTSAVAWALVLTSTANGKISSTASKSWSVTVNGTAYSGTNTVGIAASSSLTLASGATTIPHNSNGTKTFSYSFSQQFGITFSGVSIGTISGSGSGTLTTIARASSITSAANVTMGNACSIKWTPASSSFTYKLKFVCGSGSYTTGTISPATTAAYTYTGYDFPVASCAPYVTNATSATVTATLTTYSGTTAVGTATKTFTLYVPASIVPAVSISVAQAKTYISGKWLTGYSKPVVTITKSGAYGSTISSVKTTFNAAASTNTSSVTFAAPASAGSYTVSTTVTDSRGRTATASTTLTYVAYTVPQITGVSLIRASDTSGTADSAAGAYGYLKFGYAIASVSSTNTISVTAKYKLKTASTYTALVSYTSTYTRTGLTAAFAADTGASYDVVITATDAVTSVTKSLTLPTVAVLLHFGSDGKSLGIGKLAERAGLDIGCPTWINGFSMTPTMSTYTEAATNTAGTITFAAHDGVRVFRWGRLCIVSIVIKATQAGQVTFQLGGSHPVGDTYGVLNLASSPYNAALVVGAGGMLYVNIAAANVTHWGQIAFIDVS